ncbi:nicotinate-nucleotide--dimethylbenzimidazole phosphoribosyltransferase [Streptomyces sp. NBC_00285]|uniref:nicotinate-nucleotide--dimethylbenzimidazole phosphoribosyltransferase n=1 Tax=Streptomyces sp. NBC_00285 TaxID=2975700 RepID=UPI002E2DB1FA|nr:nicotinate-nucleotide--dimethylbenzimidazole phosphoribosyltransferase [Streptomyces sp. NBC_00285]
MTDTGQVPAEGLPENAGMVEQPGVPGAYTYLSETTAEDEDLLLLPGAQSPWGNEVAPPAPEPVVETVHEPGPHEMSGRDSGAHDLSAVRRPQLQAPSVPIPPITPRRPLHLGPPIPDASASPVRSLADRGPAGVPVRQPAAAPAGTEYFETPQPQGAVPWGAPLQAAVRTPMSTVATAAETVVPEPEPEPVSAAQATMARLASEAGTAGYAVQAEAPAARVPYAGLETEPAQVPLADADRLPTDGFLPDAVHVADADAAPAADAGPAGDGSVPDADVPAGQGPVDAAQAPEAAPFDDAGQNVADVPGVEQAPESDLAVGAEPEPDAGHAQDQVEAGVEAVPVAEDVQAGETPEPEAAPTAELVDVDSPVPGIEPGVAADEAADAGQVFDATDDADGVHGQMSGAVVFPEAAAAPQAVAAQDVTAAPEEGVIQDEAVPLAGLAPQHPAAQHPTALPDPAAAPALEPVAAPRTEPTPDHIAAEAPAPDAPEDVTLEAPVETEHAPHPTDVGAPAEVPLPHAEPEPLLAEQAAPAPEPFQEPAQDAPAPVAPVAEYVADIDVQPIDVHPMEPAAAFPAEESRLSDHEVHPSDTATPEGFAAPDQAPQGPQPAPQQPFTAELADAQPWFVATEADEAPAVLPTGVPPEPRPAGPVGEFVEVDGSVPTTPHLAPTPPHPLSFPADEAQPVVPAPREADGDPELVQQADDLDTRAADQEDQEVPEEVSTAPVEEVRQSTGPAAPAYDDVEREAVLKVMRERRDIRNGFRSDPIPHEVLLRVLEAAHTAPSVGHSQPWDFVVIRSAETRGAMHELAQRQRDAYAKSLPKGRAKQFKELKIEAILDTPVNIVVTADPTRGGRHTLGRHTQPQMAPYSAALAVENLWLAARAEGLGVGWVSFFDEREMVRVLGLPDHLEVIAYLCVGYVDEFPDEPELMQAGWSKRRPLSWVVHEETYGRRALPGEEPHDLLSETVAQIRPLDAKALGEAWERQKRMTKPAGALGMLEIISAQLSGLSRQCPPPIPEPAAVAIFAGDHGVHAQGVTPWPQEVTAQMVANFLGGGAVCNAFAAQVGAEVCVVDVGVAAELPATPGLLPRKIRAGTSDMTTGTAMTREEAKQAIEVGIETARDLVAAGNKALLTGEMGIANTTASAALISVFTDTDPAEVTGRGTGINDETLARKTEVVRRAIELHQPDPADPIGVLAAIGGFEHAAMVGLLLGGASLRTPVILDGVSAGAAALVARAIAPEVLAACIAGHRSAEPGHVAALNKLGLRPLVDLDLRLGEGTGALLALPLVQSTARAMHEVATFDSAGVTEK